MKSIGQHMLYAVVYGALYLLSLLPLSVLYVMAGWLSRLLFNLAGYRRGVVIQNLARAFPDKRYAEVDQIARGFYRSFMDWIAETVKLMSMSSGALKERVELVGFDYVRDCIANNRNVIAGIGHFGNWEMLSILPELLEMEVYSVYKPLSNGVMDRLMCRLRSRRGMKLLAAGKAGRHMLGRKRSAALYLFIADQCPPASDHSDTLLFLNQPTQMLPGIEKLSKAVEATVVYFFMKRTARGHYEVECIPICKDPRQESELSITASYKDLLEYNIQASPDNWLWTHKRWKERGFLPVKADGYLPATAGGRLGGGGSGDRGISGDRGR